MVTTLLAAGQRAFACGAIESFSSSEIKLIRPREDAGN
jgi:hypothetical protein